ncbi:MAG TPA: TetR/AcrR family transcriptional regulator [Baekduia sp.]|nr:TetR/AcrR family transcriptional regulator [Baekduia sp.]
MPTAKPKTDRRAALLAAGLEAFEAKPYEEVSVGEIADAAGVAHGLLFHYFGTKRAFYQAVQKRLMREGMARMAGNQDADPTRWLKTELTLLISSIAEQRHAFLGTIWGDSDPDSLRIRNEFREFTVARIARAAGLDAPHPMLHTALCGWIGYCLEASAHWLTNRHISRTKLRALLAAELRSTLHNVAAIEPAAVPDPDVFD